MFIKKNEAIARRSKGSEDKPSQGYNLTVPGGIVYIDQADYQRLMSDKSLVGFEFDEENPTELKLANGNTLNAFNLTGFKAIASIELIDQAIKVEEKIAGLSDEQVARLTALGII